MRAKGAPSLLIIFYENKLINIVTYLQNKFIDKNCKE